MPWPSARRRRTASIAQRATMADSRPLMLPRASVAFCTRSSDFCTVMSAAQSIYLLLRIHYIRHGDMAGELRLIQAASHRAVKNRTPF